MKFQHLIFLVAMATAGCAHIQKEIAVPAQDDTATLTESLKGAGASVETNNEPQGIHIQSHSPIFLDDLYQRSKPKLKKGDIVLMRGQTWISDAIIHVSRWTHGAIVYDVAAGRVMESVQSGVHIGSVHGLGKGSAWSVKRVKASDAAIASAVEIAKRNWAKEHDNDPTKMPYFPPRRSVFTSLQWAAEWADKNSRTSMYCFKLIYQTFLSAGKDLDSNRTSLSASWLSEPDLSDSGATKPNAFIGITGDDIYYSKNVGDNILSFGLDNLRMPLLANAY